MEQKLTSRIQVLESALAEMNSYLKELGSARAWLEDALEKTQASVPQTLSVEDLDRSRKNHEASYTLSVLYLQNSIYVKLVLNRMLEICKVLFIKASRFHTI